MATGQFALLPLLQPGGARRLPRFLRKTGLLYGACILLYLPLGIYGGQYAGLTPLSVVRLLLFDGTYYHLWYFPARAAGRVPGAAAAAGAGARRGADRGGAALRRGPFRGQLLRPLPRACPRSRPGMRRCSPLSSFARNGIFFAPLFLLLGAELGGGALAVPRRAAGAGLALSLLLFAGEALALRALAWPRHDSMAVFLVPRGAVPLPPAADLPLRGAAGAADALGPCVRPAPALHRGGARRGKGPARDGPPRREQPRALPGRGGAVVRPVRRADPPAPAPARAQKAPGPSSGPGLGGGGRRGAARKRAGAAIPAATGLRAPARAQGGRLRPRRGLRRAGAPARGRAGLLRGDPAGGRGPAPGGRAGARSWSWALCRRRSCRWPGAGASRWPRRTWTTRGA